MNAPLRFLPALIFFVGTWFFIIMFGLLILSGMPTDCGVAR